MGKNILLTSLGHVDQDRLNHRYFYYGSGNDRQFCDSITTPEAGAKLILSKVNIDEIIVLGNEDTFDSASDKDVQTISKAGDFDDVDINKMSEFGFFRYRISQFRDGIDLESLDIRQSIEEGTEKLKETAEKYRKEILSDADYYMNSDKFLEGLSYEEIRWIKTYIYKSIDQDKKIKILDGNKNILIRFVPTARDNRERLTNINELIDCICGTETDVSLYMDMQGMESADAYTLISLAMLLNNAPPHALSLRQLITTHYDPRSLINPIDDQDNERYQVSRFAEGINSFIQYGKVQMIRDYWISRKIRNDRIEAMLHGMTYIDCGISLCNIDNLEKGIKILKEVFNRKEEKQDVPGLVASLFLSLEKTIKADYGKLLEGDRIKMYELARWALRKGFYQQALTIIESKFPTDMVYYGIFYYANDEDSKNKTLWSLQQNYIRTQPMQRWCFKEIDHYYIKYYNKSSVDKIRDKKEAFSAYIQYRLDQLVIDDPKKNHYMVKAFLRNKLNHSDDFNKEEDNKTAYDVIKDNLDIINTLTEQVNAFLDLFGQAMDTAISRAEKNGRPNIILISAEEFKAYSIEESRQWKEKNGGNKGKGNRNVNINLDRSLQDYIDAAVKKAMEGKQN